MNIYLTRHGNTLWNDQKRIQGSTDIELSDKGIQEAHYLARTLKEDKISISKIYTSIQKRAEQTAQILSESLEIPMQVLDGFQEISLGMWEGKTWDQAHDENPQIFEAWSQARRHTPAPLGESYQGVLQRSVNALEYIVNTHNQSVLVVTHSGVIMALLCLLNETPFEEMIIYHVNNAEYITLTIKDVNHLKELI